MEEEEEEEVEEAKEEEEEEEGWGVFTVTVRVQRSSYNHICCHYEHSSFFFFLLFPLFSLFLVLTKARGRAGVTFLLMGSGLLRHTSSSSILRRSLL